MKMDECMFETLYKFFFKNHKRFMEYAIYDSNIVVSILFLKNKNKKNKRDDDLQDPGQCRRRRAQLW